MEEQDIKHWLELNECGKVVEASKFYYENMFDDIIDDFVRNNADKVSQCNVLFSILGYSPEPIILTQRALHPDVHVIFTTNENKDPEILRKILSNLKEYLKSEHIVIYMEDDNFSTIYETLKEQMIANPSTNYVIDITGGKKSMVASASIFARDYNCKLVYVDYDQYLPNLRKPLPGTEKLNLMYEPAIDLPELKTDVIIKKEKKKEDKQYMQQNKIPTMKKKEKNGKNNVTAAGKATASITVKEEYEDSYKSALVVLNKKSTYSNHKYKDSENSVKILAGKYVRIVMHDKVQEAYAEYKAKGHVKSIIYYVGRKIKDSLEIKAINKAFENLIYCIDEQVAKKRRNK